MEILITNNQADLPINEREIEQVVIDVLRLENVKSDEVSIQFVSKDVICRLHDEYFQDPSPTDCISFPIDDSFETGYSLLGEVFVCPAVAKEYAEKTGGSPWEETILYVIHGLLHLIGYDDLDEEDRLEMRSAEKRHLQQLRQKKIDSCKMEKE